MKPTPWRNLCGMLCVTLLCAQAWAGDIQYSYDNLGRLIKVVYSGSTGAKTITYTYDAAGNRTQVVTLSP